MPPSKDLRMGATEWALLFGLSILWGLTFFLAKIAVAEISPVTVVLARVTIGAAVLAIVIASFGLRFPATLSSWTPFLIMGLINNVVPFSLIFWGQKEIGAGLASVLNAATPLSGAVMAHIFTADEKLHSNRLLGVLLGIAGVAVLVGPSGIGLAWGPLLGAASVIGGTLSYGLASVYGKRLRDVPALVSACCQLASSTLIMTPIVLVFDPPWLQPLPSAKAMTAVLAIALLATALAYVIFFTILRRAGASNVMLVTLLVPFTATGLGVVFLGEHVTFADIAGAALVGLALLVIDGRLIAAFRRKTPSASSA
jgi:drug/metabolite transporter (DMT)-like permease